MAKFDRSPLKYSPFRSKRLIPSKTLSASHRKPRASSADSAVALRPVVLATPRDEDPQDLPRYFADLDACRANRGADGAWVSPEQLGQDCSGGGPQLVEKNAISNQATEEIQVL